MKIKLEIELAHALRLNDELIALKEFHPNSHLVNILESRIKDAISTQVSKEEFMEVSEQHIHSFVNYLEKHEPHNA